MAEATALYERVATHVRISQQNIDACTEEMNEEIAESSALLRNIRGRKAVMQANQFLKTLPQKDQLALKATVTGDEVEKVLSKMPLFDQRGNYRAGSTISTDNANLVAFPPAMEAVSCKPLFFDLGSNGVEFPSLTHRTTPVERGVTGAAADLAKGVAGRLGLGGWFS